MRLLLALLLVACGSSGTASVPANTAANTHVAPQPTESVEDVATRLGRAALTGDRATALSLTLTFDDMTTISVKAAERTKADWDAEVADFFDGLAREGKEAQPMQVVGAKVVKSGMLKKGEDEKVLRDIEFAFVQLEIQQGTEAAQPRGLPMIFLKTNAGWRFSPRP